jgi:hypothetical protein
MGIGCSHGRCRQYSGSAARLSIADDSATATQVYKTSPKSKLPAIETPAVSPPPFEIEVPPVPSPVDLKAAQALPAPQSVTLKVASVAHGAEPERIRAFDTVQIQHPQDFAWVVGQLQYIHATRKWRVRYLPCDIEDQFGGVVTITGAEHLAEQFKEGATVHLQGQLVDPDTRKAAPEYYTWGITVLKR